MTTKTAVLYTRVSTDEQASMGYSLRDQEARLRQYCQRNSIHPLEHFQEDHSAKDFEGRPAWARLMAYVRANRADVDMLLFVKWSRFSRNATDALQMIRTLEGLGVEAQAIEQPIDRSVPEQLMMLAIYVAAPQVDNERRSLATIRGMRRAGREGRWTTTAPCGYRRVLGLGGKSIIVPDEDGAAPLVREAFERAAHTDAPLAVIWKDLQARGLRASRSQFYVILQSLSYTGRIRLRAWRGEPEEIVEGQHEALVSRELFERVQERRFGAERRARRRAPLRPQLILRGHLLCPRCRAEGTATRVTGSGSQGRSRRYWYYHCHRCQAYRVSAPQVNADVVGYLSGLEIAGEVAALYSRIVEDVLKGRGAARRQAERATRKRIDGIESRLLKADTMYLDGDLGKSSHQRLKESLEAELRRAKAALTGARALQADTAEHLGYATQLLSRLGRAYEKAPLEGKSELLGSIFPGGMVYENASFRTTPASPLIRLLAGKKGEKEGPEAHQRASGPVRLPG